MDKNQIEELSGIDFEAYKHLTPKEVQTATKRLQGFTLLDKTTFYREVKVAQGRRYILCFNPELFTEQRKHREEAIKEFQQYVGH